MEQILGLHTSPNSLQIPSGATLKADNVYLDTDGYFKPFKKIEKAMPDKFLAGYSGDAMAAFGNSLDYPVAYNNTDRIKLLNVNGHMIAVVFDTNKNINYHLSTSVDTADTFTTSNPIAPLAIPNGKRIFGNYLTFLQTANVFLTNIFSHNGVKELFNGSGGLCYSSENVISFPANFFFPNFPYPYIYGASFVQVPSGGFVYNGDASRASTQLQYANAYRFTVSIKVGDFLVESKPTGSLYIRQPNNSHVGSGLWIQDMFIRLKQAVDNADVGGSLTLNIYRTPLDTAELSGLTPRESEDFRLVATINADSINEYEFDDSLIQPPGSAELYTNPTQDGILKQNSMVPLHKASTFYKNCSFFGNVKTKPFAILDLNSTGTTYQGIYQITIGSTNIWQEYSINVSTGTTDRDMRIAYAASGLLSGINGVYATHLNTSGVGAQLYIEALDHSDLISVQDFGGAPKTGTYSQTAPSLNLTVTIASHGYTNGNDLYVIPTSGAMPAGIYKVRTPITANTFVIQMPTASTISGNLRVYRVGLGSTPSGIFTKTETSNKTEFPNKILYSKPQEPFAVPLTNEFPVGSNAPILYLANLREYMLIFKKDGVFILRGETADEFQVDPLYPQIELLHPEAIQIIDDFVIGLFNIGVVRLNENGYEIISQQIKDDIDKIIKGNGMPEIPYVFYHKARRLVFVGRETATFTPEDTTTARGELAPYTAHKSFVYHVDSKQWSSCDSINLDGAQEFQNQIWFPVKLISDRPSVFAPEGAPLTPTYTFNFKWDIYRTAIGDTADDFTKKFAIRFVKQMDKAVTQSHRRFLKIYFREMNFTSMQIDFFPNYEINNLDRITATYDNIVTFGSDGVTSTSRSVAYFMIPTEVARANWLAFELKNPVSSGVEINNYNGILIEGFEIVDNPSGSATQ